MVKIAVAGGTGNVATELLRAPIASGQHEITIFTRREPPVSTSSVSYQQVDYHDRASLTDALRGFDVCLSFLIVHLDQGCVVQKNLVHACIDAGVARFAPSEWGIGNNSGISHYNNKDIMAAYLHDLKSKGELGTLEYSLFQPSIFMDYFAHPHPLSPNLITWPLFVDFERRKAIVLDQGDQLMVLTAISDVSHVLNGALLDPRPWPVHSSMRGAQTSINELLTLGQRIRGGDWTVEYVKSEDIRRRELKTSWVPQMAHPVVPEEQRAKFSIEFIVNFFQALLNGAWAVGDEWNQRQPDFQFIGLEEYLSKAWAGKS